MNKPMRRLHFLLAGLLAVASAAWAQPTPAPAAESASALGAAQAAQRRQPPPDCLAVLDKLAADLPRDESGPALRAKGLRIRSPILVPEEVIKDRSVVSGVRVRVLLDATGTVVPGSVVVQQAVGDVNLPMAMSSAVPQSLSFDVSAATSVPKEFAFTTVYLVCAER
jgi:hypothetical protein